MIDLIFGAGWLGHWAIPHIHSHVLLVLLHCARLRSSHRMLLSTVRHCRSVFLCSSGVSLRVSLFVRCSRPQNAVLHLHSLSPVLPTGRFGGSCSFGYEKIKVLPGISTSTGYRFVSHQLRGFSVACNGASRARKRGYGAPPKARGA